MRDVSSVSGYALRVPVSLLSLCARGKRTLRRIPILFFFASPSPTSTTHFRGRYAITSARSTQCQSNHFSILQWWFLRYSCLPYRSCGGRRSEWACERQRPTQLLQARMNLGTLSTCLFSTRPRNSTIAIRTPTRSVL